MSDLAHPTDLHVGTMIRARRRKLGVSQEKLAEALKLTFQQVQKYERGANRVSASKLQEIADALDCHPGEFFEGLSLKPKAGETGFSAGNELFLTHGGPVIAAAFLRMERHQRDAILRVCLAMSPEPVVDLEAARG